MPETRRVHLLSFSFRVRARDGRTLAHLTSRTLSVVAAAVIATSHGTAAMASDLSGVDPSAIEEEDIIEGLNGARQVDMRVPPRLKLPVYFEVNSDRLTPEARVLLEKVTRAMMGSDLGGSRFAIEGHTDGSGEAGYNEHLSRRRARSVVRFLEERGVRGTRLEPTGFGESQPVATNDTATGRQRNRRVEIVNLGSAN